MTPGTLREKLLGLGVALAVLLILMAWSSASALEASRGEWCGRHARDIQAVQDAFGDQSAQAWAKACDFLYQSR